MILFFVLFFSGCLTKCDIIFDDFDKQTCYWVEVFQLGHSNTMQSLTCHTSLPE